MTRICLFAGTTEGRKLAEFLKERPVFVLVCTATEYGGELIAPSENIEVKSKRLSREEMTEMFRENPFDLVVDATHPYAVSITENIRKACKESGLSYIRLLRDSSEEDEECVFVSDAEEAAAFLSRREGNILLATGSKELKVYAAHPELKDRIYARVLPLPSSLRACEEAQIRPDHILAMQGPFTMDLNVSMLKAVHASFMVTKDGGKEGGFGEKVSACKKAGVRLVVLGRPGEEKGLSYEETIRFLCSRFHFPKTPRVTIAGIGPGSRDMMTVSLLRCVEEADCLIGAGRMLEEMGREEKERFAAIDPEIIENHIFAHPEYEKFTVLMSGDTGFFSGARKLSERLGKKCDVRILPGISSLSFLCSRILTGYEDVKVVSLHGRSADCAKEVRENERVFFLVGGKDGMRDLLKTLTDAGLGKTRMVIAERLSYPDEKITRGFAEELADGTYDSLSVALAERSFFVKEPVFTPGLPDSAFIRGENGENIVPMTKSEIRAVILSKLRPENNSVCWDIGAGTGSVSVEMALSARKGTVYAVEKRKDAQDLIRKNKEAFRTENLIIREGSAPEALLDLPAPDLVFIGGSSGNLEQILTLIRQKNPKARIVAAAVTLETVAEMTGILKKNPSFRAEVTQVNIARDQKAGNYHLMRALNPVYLFCIDPLPAAGEEGKGV